MFNLLQNIVGDDNINEDDKNLIKTTNMHIKCKKYDFIKYFKFI